MKHPDAEGDWQGTPLRAGASHHLQTVPEQIAECILAAIEGGEFVPGERIREETLAEQFAVSRGPVREALRILEKDQVVRILPNRGAHVTQFSIKEVCDLFDIRRDLVAAMIRRLGRGRDEVATWIDTEVRELETVVLASGPGDPHLTIIDRLGRMLADSSGNERLAEILGSLARQTRRYAKLGLATAARRQESARNWRTLLDDLKAGDVNRAANAVEHLSDASRHEAVRQLQAAAVSAGNDAARHQ